VAGSSRAPCFVPSVNGQIARRVRSSLAIYLQDHHAAGLAGARMARRAAAGVALDSGKDGLRRVASEIEQDLTKLEEIMRRLGVKPDQAKDTLARVGERLGRLKPNGRLLRRSRLSDVLELETLVVGITGKQASGSACAKSLPSQSRNSTSSSSGQKTKSASSRRRVWRLSSEASGPANPSPHEFEVPGRSFFHQRRNAPTVSERGGWFQPCVSRECSATLLRRRK
jgi:hypothetical protein